MKHATEATLQAALAPVAAAPGAADDERGRAYGALYREYVCTTRAARRLEFAVRALAMLDESFGDTDPAADVTGQIRAFFDRPVEELASALDLDDHVTDEIRDAAVSCSTFVRETFGARFMDLNTGSGEETVLTDDLVGARVRYEELTERVDAIVAARDVAPPRLRRRSRSASVVRPVPRSRTRRPIGGRANGSGASRPTIVDAVAVSPIDGCPDEVLAQLAAHRDGPTVVSIGTFDGVHAGHRELLARASASARADGLRLTVVTFTPRPDVVLQPGTALPNICSVDERVRRLRRAGADDVVVLPFTWDLIGVPAETFLSALRDDLQMVRLCVGEEFALGRGRTGTVSAIRELGIPVVDVPVLCPQAGHPKFSSSEIRKAIADKTPIPSGAL